MKKQLKIILSIIAFIILIVIVAGIYKFNYLASQDGYNVDGNKIEISENNSHHRSKIQETEEVFIYKTPVESKEECTDLEDYDVENKLCYFECQTEEECIEIEQEIEQQLDNLSKEYANFSEKGHIHPEHNSQINTEDLDIEALYSIEKNENFVLKEGQENLKNHTKVIKWLKGLSPDDFSDTYFAQLILVSDIDEEDTMAYVITNTKNPDKWDIVVNMSFFSEGDYEMVFTLVHEFSHILTLNTSQMDMNANTCKNYVIEEGCLYNNSYLNTFYNTFWKGKFDENSKKSEENYNKNPDVFVSEYAATNPAEDIAESFAHFIFNKKPENTAHIKNQKIAFFYDYKELVELRKNMRNTLKSFVRSKVKK